MSFFLNPLRLAGLLLAGLLAGTAWAQTDIATDAGQDPPGRVARIGLVEGAVSTAEVGADNWANALLNRPLTRGDRVWVAERSRSELHIGSTAVRLNGATSVNLLTLDDDVAQLQLTQGTLSVRVRNLFDNERLQIDTPNLAFSVGQPGEYRIDVDPVRNTTRVSVLAGSGAAYGENGLSYPLGASQQVTFGGTSLSPIAVASVGPRDSFEAWVAERDRQEDIAVSARYVSRETIGYQQLDQHGDWGNDAAYGAVWYPRAVAADWAPYRYGHWANIAPWGWTWVDDAPWGFAPFHYGRWAYVGSRWGWVPGPVVRRPVYAPALVGFVGNSAGVSFGFQVGSSQPGVGWFPLGPGEAWRPYYRASPRYVNNINRHGSYQASANSYRYQRAPQAVTVVNADTFRQSRPVWQNRVRLPQEQITRAELGAAPNFGFGRDNQYRNPGRPLNATPPGTLSQREALSDRAAEGRSRGFDDRRNGDRGDDRANDRDGDRFDNRNADNRWPRREDSSNADAARQWRDDRSRFNVPQQQAERTTVPPQNTNVAPQFQAPPNLIPYPNGRPMPRVDDHNDPRFGYGQGQRDDPRRNPRNEPRFDPQPETRAEPRRDQAQRDQAEQFLRQQRQATERAQADGRAQAEALAQARAQAQAQAQAQQRAQTDNPPRYSRPGSPLQQPGRKSNDDDNRPPGRNFGTPR